MTLRPVDPGLGCAHLQFEAHVQVDRLEDTGQFIANVHVRCAGCRTRFRWKGVPMGLSTGGGAMVSVDEFELRCALEPDAHGTSLMADIHPFPGRRFPVLFPPEHKRGWAEALVPESVPWDIVAPHERQAGLNHRQTLDRLAERGGLDPRELYAVMHDEPWQPLDMNDCVAWLRTLPR